MSRQPETYVLKHVVAWRRALPHLQAGAIHGRRRRSLDENKYPVATASPLVDLRARIVG